MMEINEVVAYGAEGVCRFAGMEEKKVAGQKIEYCVLKPVDGKKATVYIPTGNRALMERVRPLPTPQEINALIDLIPHIPPNWIPNEYERKSAYGKILASGDHKELIAMIKALYFRKKEREAAKKRMGMTDERLMKEAEQRLYGEWEYVLNLSREELTAYIFARIHT